MNEEMDVQKSDVTGWRSHRLSVAELGFEPV